MWCEASSIAYANQRFTDMSKLPQAIERTGEFSKFIFLTEDATFLQFIFLATISHEVEFSLT